MKQYEVTIERTEVTILYVEAKTEDEAEYIAWGKWENGACGLAMNTTTQVKEVSND